MFAGSGGGGIPARGTDRSATVLVTGHVAGDGRDDGVGEPSVAARWAARLGPAAVGAGSAPSAATAMTATSAPAINDSPAIWIARFRRGRACRPASMPIPSAWHLSVNRWHHYP